MFVYAHVSSRIGNGSNTGFWSDLWIGDVIKFPSLFAITQKGKGSVAVM